MIKLEDVQRAHEEVQNARFYIGAAGAARIADLIERSSLIERQWMNITRARLLADATYIRRESMRSLATQLDKSPNAVSLWIKNYGPKKFVSVRQDVEEFVIDLIPPRQVADLIEAGRRVAPSSLGLYDNDDGIQFSGNAQDLWHELASQY